jgi:hypothetical protein
MRHKVQAASRLVKKADIETFTEGAGANRRARTALMWIFRCRGKSWLGAGAIALMLACGGAARADEACKLAKGDSPMAKPCAEGGIKKAKEAMKGIVREARRSGVKIECDECHKDPAKYEVLADDARSKLDKLMKAAAPAARDPAPPASPAK